MAEQVYIGVDLGAESGRVVAGIWDGQRIRVEELTRFHNGPIMLDGTLRWDVLRLWLEIQQGLTLAARRFSKQIVSVGVDTWGVDYALLSIHSELLGLPYHYRDGRTRGMLDYVTRLVPRPEIFAATGLQFMEINTLYQLLAMRRKNPELFWIADRFLLMPDFFHWCLCGAKVTEFTIATTTQCFNARERTWAEELLKKLDLPTKIFPAVVDPGTALDRLQEEVARQTGLQRIQVIAPASHDTASAVAAVPTEHTGQVDWAYLSTGTWSLLGVELQNALRTERVLELNLTNEGGIDRSYRLLKNILGLWLEHECLRAFERRGLHFNPAKLASLGSEAPQFRSLIDPGDERFLNPPDMPTAIQEFCRETSQAVPESEGELIRCIYESLALEYANVLAGLEELLGRRMEVLHAVGRGSQNALLNSLTANACGRPVLAGPSEATVLGNVLVQARAAREIHSVDEIRRIVRQSSRVRPFEPASGGAAAWQEARARYQALLKRPRARPDALADNLKIDWARLTGAMTFE